MPGIAAGHAPTVFAARTSAAASPTGRTGQGPGRPGEIATRCAGNRDGQGPGRPGEIATRCAGNRDGQGPDRPGAGQATRKRWPYYRRCLSWGL
jgi:hypothetical protein